MADDKVVTTDDPWSPERRKAHGELVRRRMAAKKRAAGKAGVKKATTNGSAGPIVQRGFMVNGKTISYEDALAVHAAVEEFKQAVRS